MKSEKLEPFPLRNSKTGTNLKNQTSGKHTKNKKKKKFGLSILLSVLLFSFSYAQDYKTGIGLRGGFASGITIKFQFGSGRNYCHSLAWISTDRPLRNS